MENLITGVVLTSGAVLGVLLPLAMIAGFAVAITTFLTHEFNLSNENDHDSDPQDNQ